MKSFIMILLLAFYVLPLAAVAEETEPVPEVDPVIKEEKMPAKKAIKKAKKAKKKAVSELPRVNAEVRSLQVGQSGEQAVATYDLVSDGAAGVAEVTVAIIIDGKRRTSDQLSLSGDFGKDVRTGAGKRIIWNATADLPAGFDGELRWDVQTVRVAAAPAAEPKLSQTVDGPSYEDTVNFIVNKYKYYRDEQNNVKIDSINGCSMAVSWTNAGKSGSNNGIDLKRSTAVYTEPNVSNSVNPMDVVMESPQFNSGKMYFWTHDATFAERFAKALQHLRKLCGAKDDPF
jgi:hypothetical protein